MRTGSIMIDGQQHLLCFSARVVQKCVERYGSIEAIDGAMSNENDMQALDEAIWMLSTLMEAGDRYAKHNSINNPAPLSYDDLYDFVDIFDLGNINGSITKTIKNDTDREVLIEQPKNE